jgi:hypothetical protein
MARKSKDAAADDASKLPKKPRNKWNDKEIAALIKSIVDQNPSAEKGGGFKKSVYELASTAVAAFSSNGQPPKSWKQCSSKLGEVSDFLPFNSVQFSSTQLTF